MCSCSFFLFLFPFTPVASSCSSLGSVLCLFSFLFFFLSFFLSLGSFFGWVFLGSILSLSLFFFTGFNEFGYWKKKKKLHRVMLWDPPNSVKNIE